jgi:hypothetical protein
VLKKLTMLAVICLAGLASVGAQEPVPPGRMAPLKLQLVISRNAGAKPITTSPFVLFLTANDRIKTRVKLGIRVPLASTRGGSSYNYQDVTTEIACIASSGPDGAFALNLEMNDSAILVGPVSPTAPGVGSMLAEAPTFRTFSSTFNILLKDGQTAQYTTATDPISGEVLKVDATLNVIR